MHDVEGEYANTTIMEINVLIMEGNVSILCLSSFKSNSHWDFLFYEYIFNYQNGHYPKYSEALASLWKATQVCKIDNKSDGLGIS